MRAVGHPVLIGGFFNGRSHPAILTKPQPPFYHITTLEQAGYDGMETYTLRHGALGQGTIITYYASDKLSDEEAWEKLMETVINQMGFEPLD